MIWYDMTRQDTTWLHQLCKGRAVPGLAASHKRHRWPSAGIGSEAPGLKRARVPIDTNPLLPSPPLSSIPPPSLPLLLLLQPRLPPPSSCSLNPHSSLPSTHRPTRVLRPSCFPYPPSSLPLSLSLPGSSSSSPLLLPPSHLASSLPPLHLLLAKALLAVSRRRLPPSSFLLAAITTLFFWHERFLLYTSPADFMSMSG